MEKRFKHLQPLTNPCYRSWNYNQPHHMPVLQRLRHSSEMYFQALIKSFSVFLHSKMVRYSLQILELSAKVYLIHP